MRRGDWLTSQLLVRRLVEAEHHPRAFDQHGTLDQVRLFEHQVDRLALAARECPRLEDGTATADVLEEVRIADVPLEELARRRRLVDVPLLDRDPALGQETPGVLAGGSGGLAVEDGCGHDGILDRLTPYVLRLVSSGTALIAGRVRHDTDVDGRQLDTPAVLQTVREPGRRLSLSSSPHSCPGRIPHPTRPGPVSHAVSGSGGHDSTIPLHRH